MTAASEQSLQNIGTKHLLMGMLMIDDSSIQQILEKHKIILTKVRANSLPTKEKLITDSNNRANLIYILILAIVIIETLVKRYVLN